MDDLLPCPFCGSAARMVRPGGEFAVTCSKLGVCYGSSLGQGGFSYKDDAIRLWNTRAPLWQPIETAPKTSATILVWVPDNRCVFAVTWSKDTMNKGIHAGWQIFGGGYRAFLPIGPTHWQPLPTPPLEKAEE